MVIPKSFTIGSLNNPILGGTNVNKKKEINNIVNTIIETLLLQEEYDNKNLYVVYSPNNTAIKNILMSINEILVPNIPV